MIKFIFNKDSKKKFLNFEEDLRNRIISKLKTLHIHPDIFSVLIKMKDCTNSTHRLRIGNYRLILFLKNQQGDDYEFVIVDIGHRREIYK